MCESIINMSSYLAYLRYICNKLKLNLYYMIFIIFIYNLISIIYDYHHLFFYLIITIPFIFIEIIIEDVVGKAILNNMKASIINLFIY